MNGRSFLRVTGWLLETGEYQPGVGWETERVRRRPDGDPGTRVELIGEDGEVLIARHAEVRESACSSERNEAPSRSRIVGYVPLLPGARGIAVHAEGRVVHQMDLAPEPPSVAIASVEADENRIRAAWKAKHDRPLWFNVFVADARRRAIPVAVELTDRELEVDASAVPGGPGCLVAVIATDGLRSASAVSEPFDLPLTAPSLTIIAPVQDGEVLPDEAFSLAGTACDAAGEPIPPESFVWLIDDEVVAEGAPLVAAGPLEPGEHRIRLQLRDDGAHDELSLTVPERTPEHDEWRRVSASLPPL